MENGKWKISETEQVINKIFDVFSINNHLIEIHFPFFVFHFPFEFVSFK